MTGRVAELVAPAGGRLDAATLTAFCARTLGRAGLEGDSVLLVLPDATRTMPVPLVLAAVRAALAGRVRRLTVVVALGTHRPLTGPELDVHLGATADEVTRHNHEWWRAETFVQLGELPRDEVRDLSGGRLDEAVPVRINRLALTHDTVLIAGPVFPHEVIGFSGGTKYLFPGLSGPEMIDASHWLGALIGVRQIIGAAGPTPVRRLVDRAATLLPTRQLCLALVTGHPDGPGDPGVHGVFFGEPVPAQAAAARLAAAVHITVLPREYRRILSIVPPMYEDLWTAAKGVYKLDPVTADGGEIVLHAPHVREFSTTHGALIRRVGYHCREYLNGRPDLLREVPRGVLAHSVHVRGDGELGPGGEERCRIAVTLATAIPPELCRAVNLGHRDPAGIDPRVWAADPDTFVVPRAGEHLYRVAGSTG